MKCPLSNHCIKAGNRIIPLTSIASIDVSDMENLVMSIKLLDGDVVQAHNLDALENAMLLKPSCLEGKRLSWAKNMWIFHNVVGHPVMQLLAVLGFHKRAMWVHDVTVPRPLGRKDKKPAQTES